MTTQRVDIYEIPKDEEMDTVDFVFDGDDREILNKEQLELTAIKAINFYIEDDLKGLKVELKNGENSAVMGRDENYFNEEIELP